MEIEILELCKTITHKDLYEIKVRFEDAPDMQILTKDKEILEIIIRAYDLYKASKSNELDKYSYPEGYYIKELFDGVLEEMGITEKYLEEEVEEMVNTYWNYSSEYECMARVDRYKITYHDSNGLEFKVKIAL